jgi:hypothetical protein
LPAPDRLRHFALEPDLRVAQLWDKNRLISHSIGEHDVRGEVWDYIAVYPSGAIWDNNPPSAMYHGKPVAQVNDAARERDGTGVSRHRSQYL